MISKNVNISRADTQLLVIISYTDFDHITSHHRSYSAQSYTLKIDRLCITMSR